MRNWKDPTASWIFIFKGNFIRYDWIEIIGLIELFDLCDEVIRLKALKISTLFANNIHFYTEVKRLIDLWRKIANEYMVDNMVSNIFVGPHK